MEKTTKPYILVVDDDRKITNLLHRALTYEGYEVTIGHDGLSGLAQALERPPDLVVLDLMMPRLDGMEVCRRLRAGGEMPILMLTAKDSVADRVAGLETGADDYLVKPFALEELLARVKALLRRRSRSDEDSVLRYADLSLDITTRRANRNGRTIELTTTEYELLAFLLRRAGQVVTRDMLMERIWGFDFCGESNVLEVYVRYLRKKLEEGGEPRLIQTVRGAGYALRE
ncbi:MAG: response regulator transcription factor [Chloroflexota bacterium]